MTAPSTEESSVFGYVIMGLIVVLFVGASSCSKGDDQSSSWATDGNYEQTAENLEAATEATAPLPMDPSAVRRGASQLKLIASLDLPGSSQIFSQNCYDALAKAFDWHQLDRCGGFDALAVRWTEQSATVGESELEYFQSEAAATRYLTIATTNGLAGSEADIRWSNLESAARKLPIPKRTFAANASVDESPSEESGETYTTDNESADETIAPASGSLL